MQALMTISEFCQIARITDRTFRNLQAKGEVPPCLRIGRRVLMRPDVVREWIEQREQTAQAA